MLRFSGVSAMPLPTPLRFEPAANSLARSATLASSLLLGTISSTSRHATARLPLMPSSMVQKIIGMVAAHLALVDHARQSAGTRQHRQQRHLRQRHRGRAIVGENDVIGRQRQFIAAAGRGAVDDGDEALAGILAGIFQSVAGLVGELAEIDLVGVGRAGQHADIGAGAEHPVLARAHHHDLDAGMFETQPLHRIGKLDIDAEIVGIQLELIAFEQAAILIDVHGQRRDLAVDIQLPMPVARRLGLKIDVPRATREDAIFTGHDGPPLSCVD